MAKFLNTSAINYHLEELIKGARDRLILISPFLKLNDRIKELLTDKNRLKIDVRIVYGKSELAPAEIDWLKELTFLRTSFCKNLHAKCYMNEEACIITSLNLYEFSQVNNNEMGVLVTRAQDVELYRDTYEEAQRIIRISEEVRISVERVEVAAEPSPMRAASASRGEGVGTSATGGYEKLTSAKLAAKLGMATKELVDRLTDNGLLELKEGRHYVTPKGKAEGGEWRPGPGGGYLLWPADMTVGES
jgi:hypothetical protein